MADASLTVIDSVLHVASTPNPRDGLAVAVEIASIDTFLERAADRTDVSAGVVVTALNGEVAAGLGVILVVDAGERLWDLGCGNSGCCGDSSTLSGPHATIIAQAAKGVLEVASAVVESVGCC